MSRPSVRKLARQFDTMLASLLDGSGAGEAFETWIETYHVDGKPPQMASPPTATSIGRTDIHVVDWWQLDNEIIGVPRSGSGYYRIPQTQLSETPTVEQGVAID